MLVRTKASRRYGFRIKEYLELQGWYVVNIDSGVPLSMIAECPADGAALKTVCTLTSRVDDTHVRIGCCIECGHITYIDRPAKWWFDHYVSDVWGSPVERGANEGIAAPHPKITRVRDRKLKSAVRLALTLPIDRSLPVCEIGCGGGVSLRQLAANGFSQLVGIEASRHRAAAVRSGGFDVLTTLFEAPEAREALGARGPFALIFAHHALEYTYHLDAVFATAAEVQKPGAYLIVAVPHQQGEPSMGILMFMPHLHSFTSTSLARLAARFGYEVADASANNTKNLNMVFRRTSSPVAIDVVAEGAPMRAVGKFVSALQLDRVRIGRRRLWWSRNSDQAGQLHVGPPDFLGRWNWHRFEARNRIPRIRSMLVTNLGPRRNELDESPLEIQFSGRIGLFAK